MVQGLFTSRTHWPCQTQVATLVSGRAQNAKEPENINFEHGINIHEVHLEGCDAASSPVAGGWGWLHCG